MSTRHTPGPGAPGRPPHHTTLSQPVSAETVLAALRTLAPPDVTVGVREICDRPLFDVERLHVRAATLRRRQEFSTGRALLRELLGRDVPIPVGSDRAPVLPPDVCASLAHDERFAVAAVAPRERVRSIGIDIEPAGPLANELTRLIVRDDDSPLDPRLTFVLKEATYKAWSGLGGRTLEFADVRVMAIGSRFWGDIIPESNRLTGTFASAAGRWLALVVVDNS